MHLTQKIVKQFQKSTFDELILGHIDILLENHKEGNLDQDEPPPEPTDILDDESDLDAEGTHIKVHKTFLVPILEHLYFNAFKQFHSAWIDEMPNIMEFT